MSDGDNADNWDGVEHPYGPKADYDAHREDTIAVPIAYVRALEVLAAFEAFDDESVPVDELREARREVANRTGRDAPYVWEADE